MYRRAGAFNAAHSSVPPHMKLVVESVVRDDMHPKLIISSSQNLQSSKRSSRKPDVMSPNEACARIPIREINMSAEKFLAIMHVTEVSP